MGGLLSFNQLYPFQKRDNVSDFNLCLNSGMYYFGSSTLNGSPGFEYGILVVFDINKVVVVQLAFNEFYNQAKIRIKPSSGSFRDWTSFIGG